MDVNPLVGEPTGEAIYFDDLKLHAHDGWRLESGCYGARRGTLLYADGGGEASPLTFEPAVKGLFAIFVGGFAPAGRQLGVYIRLSGQPHFTYMQTRRHEPSFECMFFTTVELNGQKIEVANCGRDACFDYLKFVPVRKVPMPKATGKTMGILDFADDAHLSKPTGLEADSAIRRHADAGYDMVMWKAYAVRCEYHTKIGEIREATNPDEQAVRSDEPGGENWGIGDVLKRYDTMRQAVDTAKKIGMPIFGWARINNEFSRLNHQFSATTWFHEQNCDKFSQNKEGKYTRKLSFAYEEVRKHKIDILREIESYGMDGIFIDVLRHPPLVLWDQPLVDGYIEKTGCDPRQMAGDGDEQWLRYRADHSFTQFLREVRAALKKQTALYVRTVDQVWRNLQIGCDVNTWIDEQLVDGIVFGPHCGNAVDYPETMDLRPYIERASRRVKIFGQTWRYGSVLHAECMAKDLYEQGVDGIALYESNATVTIPSVRERIWKFSRPQAL